MDPLVFLPLVAYALATVLYLALHLGGGDRATKLGRVVLGAGWLLQLADIGFRCFHLQHPASSPQEAMAFVAWIIVGGFLLSSFRYRLAAAGAFVAPASLVLMVLARVVPVATPAPAAPALSALGLVHIILSTLGVAIFGIAAVLAGLYLFQERQLKKHHFGLMRARAAPLDTLDRLGAGCVKVGFPVFTAAIVTGAIWVAQLDFLHTGRARPEYALAVASWFAFGGLLLARAIAGWQGRRAAWLTLGGFSGALLVLLVYFVRFAA